jgi:serine/threonine-protein kinase
MAAETSTEDLPPADDGGDFDSTRSVDSAGLRALMETTGSRLAVTAQVPPDSTGAGASGDVRPLLRRRLAATAALLAISFGVLLGWHLAAGPGHGRAGWLLLAARCLLPAAVAGVLLSGIRLADPRLRAIEVALFGGLTVLVALAQYVVNLEMLRDGDEIRMIAFMKNGVIQMVVMMLLYGTFIPNHPRTVVLAVAVMALAPVVSITLLAREPEFAPLAVPFRSAEQTGSNALFLLMGAGMAIAGSVLLSGLRTELRQARKFGQYRLLRKLGEGGMGEVYLAEHQLLKRPCAVKLIKAEAGSDPIAVARFEREVQSAARLSHPNTIEIYDYGRTLDGTFYYVMEYLRGLSLAELLRRHGPLPPGRAIYIFRQVCAGLAEAHGLGLVHRDLKPGNVLLAVRGGEADVAKVLDFGLVKLTRDSAADLSRDLSVSGTPTYMAPEQALGDRSLDARADIYALGAMLYFALAGRPPFTGESGFAIMMAQARDPVVPPSRLRPDLPADLEQVVLRCLAKRPADRYPSVGALSDALAVCASAAGWGPHRAKAWWAAEGIGVE